MPDFNGAGPMKRGRVTGRGTGPCRKCDAGYGHRAIPEERATEETG